MSKKQTKPQKSVASAVKGPLGAAVVAIVLAAVAAGVFMKPSAPATASAISSSSTAASVASTAVTGPNIARIAAEAKGFSVGPDLRANTAYIFFDPQCVHCAALWNSMKPLEPQTRAVWIPVGVLSRASVAQGATILAAADPVAKMNEHEALMSQRRGGISAMGGAPDEQVRAIEANTALMQQMGGTSVPYVVARHAVTGKLVSRAGAAPTAAMASFLGLRVPAQ